MARAKKTKVDGVLFDSKTEADYYRILKDKLDSDEIHNLELQVEFPILDGRQLRKRKLRPMKYTPDFMYSLQNGDTVVVEVKGYKRKDYLMRRRLFLEFYGDDYIFHEVSRKGKNWNVSAY